MEENVCGIFASKDGSSNASQGLLCHRSDLYEELKRLATGGGEGSPAILRLGTAVVASDPEQGAVTLKGGEIVDADCILGADMYASRFFLSLLKELIEV
jgi:2-polyprenyl-6-methoxyphenol hydroxylase-like FAD-dependent oxidoreductase